MILKGPATAVYLPSLMSGSWLHAYMKELEIFMKDIQAAGFEHVLC